MVQITVSYYGSLIEILDDLLRDLHVSNPEYRFAFNIGDNPVIRTLAKELGYNPTYFAEPTDRGVIFDLKKLTALRLLLDEKHAMAAELAREVVENELVRLNATSIRVSVTARKRILIEATDKDKEMIAESLIRLLMGLPDKIGPLALWERLNA
ncbi:hypothetical protein [Paenibacillus rubinfantis]|uniref:hypothetical protein n=1 Tax=Paenibacillus rubinfantis TaxID=1720296 RepID=UPI00073EE824|nr:hypothetical protein [Paenibacillus rubinfantis]